MGNTAVCDYTDLAPSSFCECDHDVEEQGYQESSISSPEILVVVTDRIVQNKSTPISTAIEIPTKLQLNNSTVNGTYLDYSLFASINHVGDDVGNGHYPTYFFKSDGNVNIINDHKFLKGRYRKEQFLTMPSFSTTTRMLFFKRSITTMHSEKAHIKSIWYGEEIMSKEKLLTNDDMRTLMAGRWVNGDVISAFLQHLRVNQNDAIILDTAVYTSLVDGRPTVQLANLSENNSCTNSS